MKTWNFTTNAYKIAGFADRDHYLRRLARSYGLEIAFVRQISAELGSTFDFDPLERYLDDYIFLRDYT